MTMITNANFLGKKIAFIQHIKAAFSGIGLKEAKEIADRFNMDFVETHFVGYFKIYNSIAYSLIEADSYDGSNQIEDKTLETKIKELTKEAIDLSEYSVAQSLIDILK